MAKGCRFLQFALFEPGQVGLQARNLGLVLLNASGRRNRLAAGAAQLVTKIFSFLLQGLARLAPGLDGALHFLELLVYAFGGPGLRRCNTRHEGRRHERRNDGYGKSAVTHLIVRRR